MYWTIDELCCPVSISRGSSGNMRHHGGAVCLILLDEDEDLNGVHNAGTL